jgi:hypothetical protein
VAAGADRQDGNRFKTERRDAPQLAVLNRTGALTTIQEPEPSVAR